MFEIHIKCIHINSLSFKSESILKVDDCNLKACPLYFKQVMEPFNDTTINSHTTSDKSAETHNYTKLNSNLPVG